MKSGNSQTTSAAAPASGGGSSAKNEPEPTREELEAEFRADDKELCHAATKIQASFRGHMTRKQAADTGAPTGDDNKTNETSASDKNDEEVLDIDLTDPDLNTAATKIQASFRGHKVRKETDGVAK